jgi:glycosyltransferase 2 family protein
VKRSLQVLAWLGATALLVYLASRADRAQISAAVSVVRWGWVGVAILANALILVSWAALWWVVAPRAERPAYATMFEINSLASALMNTMPFLGGHAAAAVLLVKRGGLTRAAALSVMALDQLGEGLAKVSIFLLVAIVAPIPDWMRVGVVIVCSAVAGLFIGMVALANTHAYIRPRVEKLNVVNRIRVLAATWAQRMETLRSVRQSILALAFAVGTKLAEGAGLLAVQTAFGVDLSFGSTALVLAAIMLGSILPLAPGNVGTYEAAAVIAYQHLGVSASTATILAIASHLCFMIPSIGVGYLLGSVRVMRPAIEPPAPT